MSRSQTKINEVLGDPNSVGRILDRTDGITHSPTFVAEVVITSMLQGKNHAAVQHRVARRTVTRFLSDWPDKPEVAKLVQKRLRKMETEWQSVSNAFLQEAVGFLRSSLEDLPSSEVGSVRAISEAITKVNEVEMVRKVVNARLAEVDRYNSDEIIGMDPGTSP